MDGLEIWPSCYLLCFCFSDALENAYEWASVFESCKEAYLQNEKEKEKVMNMETYMNAPLSFFRASIEKFQKQKGAFESIKLTNDIG